MPTAAPAEATTTGDAPEGDDVAGWTALVCPEDDTHAIPSPLGAACRSTLPLGVIAAWPNGTPLASSAVALPDADRCGTAQGSDVVVHICPAANAELTLERFDVGAQRWIALGALPGAHGDAFPVIQDSAGSRSFAVVYGVGDGATRQVLVTDHVAPLAQPLDDVHDMFGVVSRTPAGDERTSPTLVRLPALEPVALALPDDAPPVAAITFRSDGALLVSARDPEAYGGGTLFVGTPGAWTAHDLPEGAEQVAMADAEHGLALSHDALYATDDGAQSWFTVVDATDRDIGFRVLRCAANGCAADGLAIFGELPEAAIEAASDVPSDGSEDAAAVPESTWSYAYHRWRCTPPAHTTWHDDGSRHATSWGWLDHDYLPPGQTELTWTAIDARGVTRMHARPPADLHIVRVLLTSRRFALVSTPTDVAVLAAQARTIDLADLAPWYDSNTGSAEAGLLADGGALLLLAEDDDTRRARAEILLQFDADGAMVASHTFWWRGRLPMLRGVAAGPDGVLGRALASEQDATWIVYPMDGAEPITIAAPNATEPCAGGTRPWSITTSGGPIEMAWESTGYSGANVIEIGPDTACTSAVLPLQVIGDSTSYGLLQPALFAESGTIRGLAVDDSARGVTLRCAVATD
jgi:hypothetical protein